MCWRRSRFINGFLKHYSIIRTSVIWRYKTIAVDRPWHGDSEGLLDPAALTAAAVTSVPEDLMAPLSLHPAFFTDNARSVGLPNGRLRCANSIGERWEARPLHGAYCRLFSYPDTWPPRPS